MPIVINPIPEPKSLISASCARVRLGAVGSYRQSVILERHGCV